MTYGIITCRRTKLNAWVGKLPASNEVNEVMRYHMLVVGCTPDEHDSRLALCHEEDEISGLSEV